MSTTTPTLTMSFDSTDPLLPLLPDSLPLGPTSPPPPPAPAAASAPAVGMEFTSPESARAFYCTYAARAGFRVRNSKSFTSRVDDRVIMRRFVCSRQGLPSKKDPFDLSKKRRNRPSSRAGCPAMLQVNRRGNDASSRWVVSRCVLEHCHPLDIPDSANANASKKAAKNLSELPSCSNANAELPQHTGLGPGGGVAQSLLEYFKKMQVENPAFCYAVQLDQSNCVTNLMWVGARARSAYGWFGDSVVLDMTCKRNRRVVPFAAFTGLNHHRQVVVFGCAFMTDESEDSFAWLFETWLAFMGGQKPASFSTGYSKAVEAAAVRVFPEVRHRFCRRDVFSKCKEKLADVYSAHPSFKHELKKCVNEPESVNEFESSWDSLINRYNLSGNLWLQNIYNIRHKWVPVFLRDSFFGEFFEAPKLETMHKFFQRNSILTTTLRDLVMQFDKAMAGHYENELQADFSTFNSRPVMKTPCPMEKQASEIYSRAIFDLFQDELVELSGFLAEKVEDGLICKFQVTKSGSASRTYIVLYNESEKSIACSCHKFEFAGILCRHAFRVLIVNGMLLLPDNYILKRWTRNAKSDIPCLVPTNSKRPLAWRCNDLCRDAIRFADEGATSAEIYKAAKEALQKAFAEVFATKKGRGFTCKDPANECTASCV